MNERGSRPGGGSRLARTAQVTLEPRGREAPGLALAPAGRTGSARRLAVAIGLTVAALSVAVPLAMADTAVLPPSDSLPWTDPSHHSPLEVLASQIASGIAQRQVLVDCNGETDWDSLGASREFGPNGVGGFVDPPLYYAATRTFAGSATTEQLSPRACWYLWQYAMAATKPTKCPTSTVQTVTTRETVTYTAKVRRRVKVRVKINGRWVTRWRMVTTTVRKTKQVPKTTTTEVPGPPAPCYGAANAAPSGGWSEYENYVFAMLVLAHESVHLLDLTSGRTVDLPFEARAQCLGIQLIPSVAAQLGASQDDAGAVARYALDRIYPRYQNTAYWSADCRQGGSLDLTPSDGVWP